MKMAMALLAGLLATDMSGKWTLHYDKDFSGNPATHECTFQQQGEKLTGTCEGEVKLTGQVKANRVTFEHTTGKNNDIVVRYTGAISQDGSFMKGAWQYTDPRDKKEKMGRFSLEKH